MKIKVFLATPAFDGKTHVPYTLALAETTLLFAKFDIEIVYQISTSGSLLCAERNRLVDAFMKTDCTHMFCIDSDLGWPAQAALALIRHDEEFVCGVYPARRERIFTFRPVTDLDGAIQAHPKKGLIGMQYIPAGFMLLTRSVIEKMMQAHPHTRFQPKDERNEPGYALFNTEVWENEFWGEDYYFCRKAREAGVSIWADPLIEFDHAGVRGSLMNVLTTDKPNSH